MFKFLFDLFIKGMTLSIQIIIFLILFVFVAFVLLGLGQLPWSELILYLALFITPIYLCAYYLDSNGAGYKKYMEKESKKKKKENPRNP